jgi:AraC-like DNA-binding protein
MGAKQSFERAYLENLAEKSSYDAKRLAILCKLSTRQLERVFQDIVGCSPQKWLNRAKILEAQKRLLTNQTVKEVAFQMGYRHASYFCHQFKTFCGSTPKQFRAEHNSNSKATHPDVAIS